MPSMADSPNPGLRPATPQIGGRADDRAAGLRAERRQAHFRATAAALPLDEPPGVCSRFHGLRVGGGSKLAHSVVTVLPRMIAPAFRSRAMTAASRVGDVPLTQRRTAPRRPAGDVDDVLDADRNAVQRAEQLVVIQQLAQPLRFAVRALGIDVHPGVQPVIELLDAGQAVLDQIDRPQVARPHQLRGLGDGRAVRSSCARNHCSRRKGGDATDHRPEERAAPPRARRSDGLHRAGRGRAGQCDARRGIERVVRRGDSRRHRRDPDRPRKRTFRTAASCMPTKACPARSATA